MKPLSEDEIASTMSPPDLRPLNVSMEWPEHEPKWKQRIRNDYRLYAHRVCHQCERKLGMDELLRGLESQEVCIQAFTGRIFCSPGCFGQYKIGEGL